MKTGLPETPTKETWLNSVLPAKSKVGVDPWLISLREAKTLQTSLESKSHSLVALPKPNFIDQIWGHDRPKIHHHRIFPLDLIHSGASTHDKIHQLRENVKTMDSPTSFHGILLTALDDIAWLFNLRGSDIPFNPVFFSYAYVPMDPTSPSTLYIHDPSKLEKIPDHVCVKPYDTIQADLEKIPDQSCVLSDGRCNWALALTLGSKFHMVPTVHPVVHAKSIKNPTELQGFRDCHVHDGVALVKYFAWLENQLQQGANLDEVDGSNQLLEFRKQQPNFVGPSFDTISSSGPNGAIIHYKPIKPTALKIDINSMYLCDSGGQYLNGTTDVTRTLHMGTPSEFEKRAYTRVLQGHIAIDRAVFPKKTTGYVLDILARAPLWQDHLEFQHGVGHGVGHFLNVHEGPQSIACRPCVLEIPMKPGMTVTNEPGYYHPGHFGIRIENVLLCVEDKDFLKFEHVTWTPMDRRLIVKDLLSENEINWINQYHQDCWDKLNSLLKGDELALNWLRNHTFPL
ncbi:hypothetical protein HMI54_010665 [Coelomomyces lativittatus]|nr:hypothetical protein HMI54_010665 [Coelomomyces lativittatus]